MYSHWSTKDLIDSTAQNTWASADSHAVMFKGVAEAKPQVEYVLYSKPKTQAMTTGLKCCCNGESVWAF